VLLVDHQDSFVHTLGNYLRQTGAEVITARSGEPAMQILDLVAEEASGKPKDDPEAETWIPDLVVLSPGPGNPSDFGLTDTITKLMELKIPCFGVCLGLQGMVEHFGGELGILSYPMHGKPSTVTLTGTPPKGIFTGLPTKFEVARYHSLHGLPETFPDDILVTARTDDGVVMGIEHKTLPFAAVQFHPESILTNPNYGLAILENAIKYLDAKDYDK